MASSITLKPFPSTQYGKRMGSTREQRYDGFALTGNGTFWEAEPEKKGEEKGPVNAKSSQGVKVCRIYSEAESFHTSRFRASGF